MPLQPCADKNEPALYAQSKRQAQRHSSRAELTAMTLLYYLLLLAYIPGPQRWVLTCETPEAEQKHILAKFQAKMVEFLGPAPGTRNAADGQQRDTRKRRAPGSSTPRAQSWDPTVRLQEDSTQVILFPSTDVPCEDPQKELPAGDSGSLFTYLFQPSAHLLSRVVTSAQLWFYTGPAVPSSMQNLSVTPAEVLVLSENGHINMEATAVHTSDNWTHFHFSQPFLPYISQKLFVLLVRCPTCPCVSEPDKMPFILSVTNPRSTERSRRSSVPWSPAALNLLQRPSEDTLNHSHCHRGSINISFQELGWEKWIVHPSSFVFHYCHGTCSDTESLTHRLGFHLCCAALPGTMRALRVRTTSDGGYSFKYETVPNIITEDCACM
ncbi:inhibin alpha chain [Rhinatrema bivittatum]|uniref:inhibin alpha chain n=1 Tax=Rhinatrema bivittatum TaxID=194408 RepID=UPI0011265B92|nr:inhibin alpha chain [Rhinatrema bivittatum]